MTVNNYRGKTASREERLERTDIDISEGRLTSEILREWRQHRQLSQSNCFHCEAEIEATDYRDQASWTYFGGEARLGTGFVIHCTGSLPPRMGTNLGASND